MDKNIQLSIIVVSLNFKDKFEKTISSIKNQSLKNYELIVVDGKSSDGTIELIEKYKNIIDKKIIEIDINLLMLRTKVSYFISKMVYFFKFW